MPDDTAAPELDPPDADAVYQRYVETCRRLYVEPEPRERAVGLMQERSEVLSGRPEPPAH